MKIRAWLVQFKKKILYFFDRLDKTGSNHLLIYIRDIFVPSSRPLGPDLGTSNLIPNTPTRWKPYSDLTFEVPVDGLFEVQMP